MAAIVLTTLNARYSHASLGLRYLRANLGRHRPASVIREFVVRAPADAIVEALLAERPRIIGFGIYIWNVERMTEVVRRLKASAPEVTLVIGGPEVSHELEDQAICGLADFVITGWGDVTFARLVDALLEGPRPLMKVHAGEQPPLASLALPYDEYGAADLAHRTVYVEASRGCPFKCEFCLSALDATAWPFPVEPLLANLAQLYARGARHFKFVDRTFNLKVATCAHILGFFLERIAEHPDDPPFAHFELIPDRLPAGLRELVVRFPAGTLQFEIGIQTFDDATQRRIARRQDNEAACANLAWLRQHTRAHLHVDLIAGLPGEDLATFGAGFDRLVGLSPHEIQVGLLKRLRGTPLARRSREFGMEYEATPPYQVIRTAALDALTLQRLVRFARYWDRIGNSGRFAATLPLILGDAPFARFLQLSDWLHGETGRSYGLAVEALYELVQRWLALQGVDARRSLANDYLRSGARGRLAFAATKRRPPTARRSKAAERQARHLAR